MSDSNTHKRRKGSDGQSITVSVTKVSSSSHGPALAIFPSAQPPKDAPFSVFAKQADVRTGADKDNGSRPTLLVAETQDVEYESRNHTADASLKAFVAPPGDQLDREGQGYSVQYMLGVHDKKNKTLTLHAAPLHSFTPTVKAQKASTSVSATQSLFTQQKAALGSAFGTKKAIRQLNAQERNKLDSTSFGVGSASTSLQSHLLSTISASAANLPTLEDVTHEANLARATNPTPNLEATRPDEVYDINSIVTKTELASIDLAKALEAATFKEFQGTLPYRRSKFVTTQLRRLWSSRPKAVEHERDEDEQAEEKEESKKVALPTWNMSNKDKDKLRLLVHISQLFAFRQAVSNGRDAALERNKMQQKLGGAPMTIVDGMLDRYSQGQRVGSSSSSRVERRKFTATSEIKLLGYLFVLVLKVDGFSTDVTTIANDLGMGAKKVGEIFRSLGCKLLIPSAPDIERLVNNKVAASKSDARKLKQAVLKVPVEFPSVSRGPAKR
ncbi:DNA-directed RNA polymerase I subunit rpa49 [Microbotryomycetes sp. JL201]|nr:DNA-directed RNA polymerase I subunit rpa49 [Microbotryomycetes sp. JL201]